MDLRGGGGSRLGVKTPDIGKAHISTSMFFFFALCRISINKHL